jgi:hypothetical protein
MIVESWTVRTDEKRLMPAEICFMRRVVGYAISDHVRNGKIKKLFSLLTLVHCMKSQGASNHRHICVRIVLITGKVDDILIM